MKKILRLSGIFMLLFFASCATKKSGLTKVKDMDKTVSKTERSIKGTWTLDSYTLSGVNPDYVNLDGIFDHANIKCFKGSIWNFIPNNSSGSYTLNSLSSCSETTAQIIWRIIDKPGAGEYIQFKRKIEGIKDKKNLIGYTMKLVSASEAEMQTLQEIPFEGKKLSINYYFTKNN